MFVISNLLKVLSHKITNFYSTIFIVLTALL